MNVSRLKATGLTIMLTVCLAAVGSSLRADQQQLSSKSEDKLLLNELSNEQADKRANELIKSINSLTSANDRYLKAMKDASPEDRLVLELQQWLLQRRAGKDLHQLGDVLLLLEKKSQQPQLRRQVEDIYLYALSRIPLHVDRLRNEIDQLRASRLETAVTERYTIEATVAKYTTQLDEVIDIYFRHVQKMEQVGMDVEKVREDLARLLYERVDRLSGRIALSLARIDSLEERRKEIPDDTDAAKLLVASAKNLEVNTASMEAMLDLMDELQLDTESFRSELLTATRDFGSGLMNTGVAVDLARRTLKNVTGWMMDNGPKYLFKLLLVLGIIFVFRFITRFVRAGLDKAIETSRLNLSQLARRMIVNTTSNLVMLFGLMLALSQLGISLGPLLAGLGVAGFIVGFALQDTLGNFASGMMILIYRPYDLGDLVEVGGVLGKVDKMSLVSTSLLTVDNQLIVIPNNKIWGDVIKNVTAQSKRRIDMVFGIAYTDDIPKAEKILEEILNSHDRVLDQPEPMVRLHTLGASSVDFVVRPWVKVDDYWDVYWDVTRTVKLRFDEEGVSIPFPQRDVHVYYENQPIPAAE